MPMIRKRPADTDVSRVTQRQLAAAHGMSVRNVRRLAALGFPRNADGSYDLPATIRWRVMHTSDHGHLTRETRYAINGPF